jgi:DNA-binding NtrC family response regulator
LLVNHFIHQFNIEQGKQIAGISEDALALLMRHSFPGNVRELQNIIEHAMVLCRNDRIEAGCLPAELADGELLGNDAEPKPTGNPLLEAETETIRRTLREYDGHRGKTASALGIDKSTLWRKMKRYAITYP